MHMKTTIDDVKYILSQHVDELKNTYKVKTIGVFGSVSRGDNKEKSDIDMLVEFSQPIGLFEFVALQDFLKKITRKKVDLATKASLKPRIKNDILKEVIYV